MLSSVISGLEGGRAVGPEGISFDACTFLSGLFSIGLFEVVPEWVVCMDGGEVLDIEA